MESVVRNIKAAYSNLRAYIPETIKTFRQDTGKELSLKNYLEVHAIEPERLLGDRTWTQWKAAAGLAPAPADPDLAVLGAAVSRACQITAPGYLGVINDLPRSGLSLIGEDAAASNMLYSMLGPSRARREALALFRRPSGGFPPIPAFWRISARLPSTSGALPRVPGINLIRSRLSCMGSTRTAKYRRLSGGIPSWAFRKPRPECWLSKRRTHTSC